MTWASRNPIVIIAFCVIAISINSILAGDALDAKKIVDESYLDFVGLAIFFIGSMKFAFSLAAVCLMKIPKREKSISES
jgi:hypothetical protein